MRRGTAAALAMVLSVVPATAFGAWPAAGSGKGSARAAALPAAAAPVVEVNGRDVAVSWSATRLAATAEADGYVVERVDADGGRAMVSSGCGGVVTDTRCTERAVPPGTWRYAVTARFGDWEGPAGERSASARVAAPSLSLDVATVTSLPATVSGRVSGFVTGESVGFRLDDAEAGAVLSGTLTPSTVPAGGGATVAVDLPASLANGRHAVYAVGDRGDVASATVDVAVGRFGAWDLRDASSSTEVDASAADAVAGDGLVYTAGGAPTVFQADRYLAFDMRTALPPATAVTGAELDLRLGSSGGGSSCFYVETRAASTGALLATHGNASNPVGCAGSLTSFTIPLPEVGDSAAAADLAPRVYVYDSQGRGPRVDLATVTGTLAGRSFTLYDSVLSDRATASPLDLPWPLARAGDGAAYTSAAPWGTGFTGGRYLRLTFPSYLPAGVTVDRVTLEYAYRSRVSGATCVRLETYQATALLGSHGSGSQPVSCTSSTSTYQSDSVTLPEVGTRAQVNGLVVELFMRNSDSQKSQLDAVGLTVDYRSG